MPLTSAETGAEMSRADPSYCSACLVPPNQMFYLGMCNACYRITSGKLVATDEKINWLFEYSRLLRHLRQ